MPRLNSPLTALEIMESTLPAQITRPREIDGYSRTIRRIFVRPTSAQVEILNFRSRVRKRFYRCLILLNRADHQTVWILLRSFDTLECDTILKRLSFGFRPADRSRTLFKTFKPFNRCAPFKTLHIGQFKSSILQTGPARTTTLKESPSRTEPRS